MKERSTVFSTWRRNVNSRKPAFSRGRPARSRHGCASLLTLERLEDRTLLSFGAPTTYPAGTTPLPTLTQDFNGDWIPEVITFNNDGSIVSLFRANGDGSFQNAVNYPTGARPIYGAVADYNLDDIPDLALTNEGPDTVGVYLGRGDGTFRRVRPFNAGGNPHGIVAGDFNGDGKPDVAVANSHTSSYNIGVFLGNGNGTFGPMNTFGPGQGPT